MKNKKIIIIISLILVLVVIITSIIFVLFNKKEVNNKTNKIKKETVSEEKINKENKDTKKEDNNTSEEVKEEIKEEVNQSNNTNQNNTQNPITSNNNSNNNQGGSVVNQPPPKQPVYSCPGGYSLSGTQCISTIDASFGCSDGLVEFSDGNVSGCVNLNDSYVVSEENSCKPGEGSLLMITIGGPDTYKCVPIRSQKSYSCPGGYSLQGTTCTSVIAATVS